MCGFVGICNLKRDISNEKNIIKNMNLKLQKRGPDEEGYFFSNNINLGHRRLIIIDKENGKQPMSVKYNDVIYTIVYNGQIYNKEEIREELKNLGYSFIGYSDTEVLLKAFIEFGSSVLKSLNGIFSFAIWNDKKQELFLARDHFGIKPLYYTTVNEEIIFSSEIKAILEHPRVNARVDETGIAELFGIRTSTYTWNFSI